MIPDDVWIPDRELYQPRFSPWFGGGEFGDLLSRIQPFTLVSEASCHALYTLARQSVRLGGELWECGVAQGGTAMLLAEILGRHDPDGRAALRLFDTFDGSSSALDPRYDVPYPKRDRRTAEEIAAGSLDQVRRRLAGHDRVRYHPGLIPASFEGLDDVRIALAHIDVNYHQAVRDCCAFIYPRLLPGGVLIFDDYGFASCAGARRAVDDFFRDLPEEPFVSPTAQALVFKIGTPERGTALPRSDSTCPV